MMKKVLIAGLLLMACSSLLAQAPEKETIPVNIQGIAMSGGLKLSRCCTFSQKELKTEVSDWKKMADSGKYVIEMKVSWKGGVTGKDYWIKGRLSCNLSGCDAHWISESQSEGFSNNYNSYCPLDCLEFFEKKVK
jgi:hypothetical protein